MELHDETNSSTDVTVDSLPARAQAVQNVNQRANADEKYDGAGTEQVILNVEEKHLPHFNSLKQKSHGNYVGTSMVHKQAKEAPILYITGIVHLHIGIVIKSKCIIHFVNNQAAKTAETPLPMRAVEYFLVLNTLSKSTQSTTHCEMIHEGTEKIVWNKIIAEADVQRILQQWRERVRRERISRGDGDVSGNISISDICPFRMVLHRVKRMKMMYGASEVMERFKGASDCKHFALMWIPSNFENGMDELEFNQFIHAMRKCGYFVNKLNKESVYISGPSYGNKEESGNSSQSMEPKV